MFYLSLIDDYHGLSNRGVNLRASYNAGLAVRPYKRKMETALNSYQTQTEWEMSKGLAVGTADNYNQQYWLSKVDSKRQYLQNFNGSVAAVSLIPKPLDMSKGPRNLESIVPPLQYLHYLDLAMEAVNNALAITRSPGSSQDEWKFFEGAEVTEQQVHCIPLKMPKQELKRRRLPPHDIGLTHFRPLWISEANAGSNKGSYEMFHRLYQDFYVAYLAKQYIPIRFDIKIYNTFLRVSLIL